MDTYDSLKIHCGVDKSVEMYNNDSIEYMKTFSDKSFDYCFTSVPYFDAEEYSNSETQSCFRYTKYSDWFSKFLIPCIKESRRVCKKVSINVANTGGYLIADDLKKYLIDKNIVFETDYLRSPRYGKNVFYEPIFTFSK